MKPIFQFHRQQYGGDFARTLGAAAWTFEDGATIVSVYLYWFTLQFGVLRSQPPITCNQARSVEDYDSAE